MTKTKSRHRKTSATARRQKVLADDLRRYRAFDSIAGRLKGFSELLTQFDGVLQDMMRVGVQALAPAWMNDAERRGHADQTVRELRAKAARTVLVRRALRGEDTDLSSADVADLFAQRAWSEN